MQLFTLGHMFPIYGQGAISLQGGRIGNTASEIPGPLNCLFNGWLGINTPKKYLTTSMLVLFLGESTGNWWIPLAKQIQESPVMWSLYVFYASFLLA